MGLLSFGSWFLIIMGSWPVRSKHAIINQIYSVYSYGLRLNMAFYYVTSVIGTFKHSDYYTAEDIQNQMSMVILCTMAGLKWIKFSSKYAQDMIKKVEGFEETIIDETESKMHVTHVKTGQKINTFLFVTLFGTFIVLNASSFKQMVLDWTEEMTERYSERPLPLAVWIPFLRDWYYLRFAWEIVNNAYSVVTILSGDFFFLALITFCLLRLQILEQRLLKLDEVEWKNVSQEETYKIVRSLIITHKEIIAFVEDVDNLMSNFMLMDFLTRSVYIALLLLQLIKLELGPMFFFVTLLAAFSTYQLSIFYWNANNMYLTSLKISDAAYHSGWYNMGVKSQKLLLLLMLRAQRPLCFHAGPVFIMTTAVLVQIYKAVYTLLATVQSTAKQFE